METMDQMFLNATLAEKLLENGASSRPILTL